MDNLKKVNLTITSHGEGENIMILIHPYPVNASYFSKMEEFLPSGWKALMPDLPGFGKTPEDVNRESMNMSYLAHVIKDIIPDRHKKLVIGGVSMGGYITMAFIHHYPDLADAYILANTRDQADADGGKGREEVVKRIERGERSIYIEELLPKLLAKSNLSDSKLVEETQDLISSTTDMALIQSSRGMGKRMDSQETMGNVEKPILLITGDQDSITGLEVMEDMHNRYQNSELHIVKDAGHYAFFESPSQSSKIIREFLEKL